MQHESVLDDLPLNFRYEKEALISIGIDTWEKIKELKDEEIALLVKTSRSNSRSLKRLNFIALFVCDLDFTPAEAALLIHAGIASITALSNSSPQELVKKIGRLKRQLTLTMDQSFDLPTAYEWIKRAQESRQNLNYPNLPQ